jgi:hypothetical protein
MSHAFPDSFVHLLGKIFSCYTHTLGTMCNLSLGVFETFTHILSHFLKKKKYMFMFFLKF